MMNLDIEDQWRLSHDQITLVDWLGDLTWGRGINGCQLIDTRRVHRTNG